MAKRACARGKQGSKPTVPERTARCTFVGREFTQYQQIRPQSVCTTRLIDALSAPDCVRSAQTCKRRSQSGVGSVREVSYALPPEPAVGPTRRVPSGPWHTERGGGPVPRAGRIYRSLMDLSWV